MVRTASIPESTRIGRTALVVTDLDEMVGFYGDVVGLELQSRDGDGAVLGAGGAPLLVLAEDEAAPPRRPAQAGLFHNAFRVPSRAALGDALGRVRDRWELDGASDHYVSEALYLTDPEDNGVEIYRDRPREAWPRTDDGRVAIGTEPLGLDDVAAAAEGAEDAPPESTVGHVHLEVTSLADAREFYVDTLGFGLQSEFQSALFLAAGGYHHHLGLNTWRNRTAAAGGRGLSWFELVVPEGGIAAVRSRLRDAGVAVEESEDGIETTDPDGIRIRLRSE